VTNWPSSNSGGALLTPNPIAIMTDKKLQSVHKNRDEISQESILKVSKEVAIKFIEMGRITPATFDETFRTIHSTIKETVQKG